MRIVLIASLFLLSCSSFTKRSTFKIRPYKQITLSNGLNVITIEDHSLPYFSLSLMVHSGSSSDSLARSGLAYVTGEMLDKGTNKRSATAIADSFGQIGSEFHVNVSDDYTLLKASSLSLHKEHLLKDFTDVLLNPAFQSKEIRRVKRRTLSELEKLVDEPGQYASLKFSSYLYGAHPYGRLSMGRILDVKKMRKKDIIKFYLSHYRPNNATLAIVGDFKSKDFLPKLEEIFRSWKPRKKDKILFSESPDIDGVKIKLIHKNDLAQSQIRIGHLGIKRRNKDYLALKMATTILGGAFHSRLMSEIRVKRGLTYNISASFQPLKDEGPFLVSTFTRHEKVGETVNETLKILKEFTDKGVTKKELKDGKALLKGMFPRLLERADLLAHNLLVLNYYGVSYDYLSDFFEDIDDLNRDQVNEVIKKYIHPDRIKILVYGAKPKVLSQLKGIAPVELE